MQFQSPAGLSPPLGSGSIGTFLILKDFRLHVCMHMYMQMPLHVAKVHAYKLAW